jgi:hypothetical protein
LLAFRNLKKKFKYLTIYYVIRKKTKTLKMKTLTIKGLENDIHVLCADIENRLQGKISIVLLRGLPNNLFMNHVNVELIIK